MTGRDPACGLFPRGPATCAVPSCAQAVDGHSLFRGDAEGASQPMPARNQRRQDGQCGEDAAAPLPVFHDERNDKEPHFKALQKQPFEVSGVPPPC